MLKWEEQQSPGAKSSKIHGRDKWVPLTPAWHVLRWRMEERLPDIEGIGECIE